MLQVARVVPKKRLLKRLRRKPARRQKKKRNVQQAKWRQPYQPKELALRVLPLRHQPDITPPLGTMTWFTCIQGTEMSDMAQTDMPGTALTMVTSMTAHMSTSRGGCTHLSGGQSQTTIGTDATDERTGIVTATGTIQVSMTDGSLVTVVH